MDDRSLPSSYSAATVSDLIADINLANAAGGTNTIALTAKTNTPYVLTAINNAGTDGNNGLPVIAANDSLTIGGNKDTIERGTTTAGFRLFDVATGASLTLENLTLQGGYEEGAGAGAEGAAIYNQGAVTLTGVIVQNNIAAGDPGTLGVAGADAAGGGIYSNGALILGSGTMVQNNEAIGGAGGAQIPGNDLSVPGGSGSGGGIDVAGGTAALTGTSLTSNTAEGGQGGTGSGYMALPGDGGHAGGGGLELGGGSLTVSASTFASNVAEGGAAGDVAYDSNLIVHGRGGDGLGGGVLVLGGTAGFTGTALSSNIARGGNGPTSVYVGDGFGGAMAVDGGTVTLVQDSATKNFAQSGYIGTGTGTYPGVAGGGGLDIAPGATVFLDAYALANVTHNQSDNIEGTYVET